MLFNSYQVYTVTDRQNYILHARICSNGGVDQVILADEAAQRGDAHQGDCAGSEEGEVISTIAIATSSIVTTAVLAIGIIAFAPFRVGISPHTMK